VTEIRTLPGLDIVRTTLIACESREAANDAGGLGVMVVRFSPFNTWYRIASFWEGDFMERTVPGAFKRTIDAHNSATKVDSHNVKTLFNHGQDFYVGDKLLGDILSLSEEKDSPVSEVNLWDTSYNRDLLPGLRSGSYGSSFMFRVVKDEWNNEPEKSDSNPDGIPERTIKEARLFEAGPVTWPASPTASAGMRCVSATDTFYEHLGRRDPARVEQMRSALIALRSADERPEPAPEPPTDSPKRHSEGPTSRQRREALYPYLRGAQ
jgi:HK97 family phage prohead protease